MPWIQRKREAGDCEDLHGVLEKWRAWFWMEVARGILRARHEGSSSSVKRPWTPAENMTVVLFRVLSFTPLENFEIILIPYLRHVCVYIYTY